MTLLEKSPWFATASRRKRWLVGVSGGADSVALLHLLVEAGFLNLVVCHLDHRLRGRASTEDAKFVSRLAKDLGLECKIGKSDVKRLMKQRGESMETAARFARHQFFAASAGDFKCNRIVMAHHADDQAETVLWNLLRGSCGLKGMREAQRVTTASGVVLELHRPLLGLRHPELVGWLAARGKRWREDASNAEPVAVRNRLRNEAFPLLDSISGRDSAIAFARGARDTEDFGQLLEWALDRARVRDPQGRLHLGALRELPGMLQREAIRVFLADHQIGSLDRMLIENCVKLMDVSAPAAVNLPGGGRLRRSGGRIWIGG